MTEPLDRAHLDSVRRRRGTGLLVRIAAILVIGIGTGLVLRALERGEGRGAAAVYTTERGERKLLRLPDGSQVTLGADSRLTIARGFDETRNVTLEGQAYFNVTHEEKRPFQVHAGTAVTRVLGTEFDVSAYRASGYVQVVVASGRVSLRAAGDRDDEGALLTRNQLGLLRVDGTITVQHGVDVRRHIAWTTGELAFYDMPLRDVLTQLQHWYELDFQVADPELAKRRITATMPAGSVEEVLDALTVALDAKYTQSGRTVRIQPSR